MSTFVPYLIQLAVTLAICIVLTAYLRPHLNHVLVDLCRTEPRARFWSAFADLLLIALPVIFGLGYHPGNAAGTSLFFDVARQIQGTLAGFILALLAIGFVVSFFALVAPRPQEKA